MSSLLLSSNSYIANSGDNTAFRAYGTAIANAFANAGWVGVDTNSSVNWTTVVANGSANATQVNAFEVWRMDDALQNTTPVFVKLEYMTVPVANYPTFRLTVGAGTDGVGNLTGPKSPNTAVCVVANTQSFPSFFCGDTNRIIMQLFNKTTKGSSNAAILLSIERTHDANENDTSDGVLVIFGGKGIATTSTYTQYFWNSLTGYTLEEAEVGIFLPDGYYGGNGNVVYLYPIYLSRGDFCNPSLNALVVSTYNATIGSSFTITHYGSQHTYLITGQNMFSNRAQASAPIFPIAMRWE